MMLEESVQAAIDLHAAAMPIHWAAFTLALHPWCEPVERLTAEALRLGLQEPTPRIGRQITIGGELPNDRWWGLVGRNGPKIPLLIGLT